MEQEVSTEVLEEEVIVVEVETNEQRVEIHGIAEQGQKGDKGDPGDVADVKVNGTSVVNGQGVANIDLTGISSGITNIENKIPNQASSSNQLADKNFVNSSLNSITAHYINKNANGDPFNTKSELNAATTFYSGGEVRVPTRNDYCIVLEDESKTDPVTSESPTTRYIYQNNQWEYQYTVNKTSLTANQLAAINSGITSGKVSEFNAKYDKPGTGIPKTDLDSSVQTSLGLADSSLQAHQDISGKVDKDSIARLNNVVSKNLYNKNIQQYGWYETNITVLPTGIRATATGSNQYKWGTIKLDDNILGKTITLSATITPSSSNKGSLGIWFGSNDNQVVQQICILESTGSISATVPATFPSGCDRINLLAYSNTDGTGVSGAYVDYTNLQIEEGNTQTYYVPYLNLEEAMQENNIYSTNEQVVGQWIDGKPIYRKVISVSYFPNNNSIRLNTGYIFSEFNVLKMYGIAKSPTAIIPIPFFNSDADATSLIMHIAGDGTILLKSINDYSKYSGYIILEYTKTTD